MKPQVQVPDIRRFLLGDTPATFLLEVALRLVVLYVMMAIAIRLMGRRASAELTRNELLAIVALAAAVGPAMQAPDRGLLPPMMIAAWVVVWQRVVAAATYHSARLERAMHGQGAILLSDGVVDPSALKESAVSRERLFAELRAQGLMQLGQVQRVYLEPDGSFCVIQQQPPKAGLSLVPTWDEALRREQSDDGEHVACAYCGQLRPPPIVAARCLVCEGDAWVPPVAAPPAPTPHASSSTRESAA
jgi:uncharacterized membrane protein YcaP (DUF421 family)